MGITKEYRIEEKYNHNILSVIFDSDSFFYGISDVNNQLKSACKYDLEENALQMIPEIIKKENLANHYYSAVNIYSKSSKFTFVPASEYFYGIEDSVIRNSFEIGKCEIGVDVCNEENLHIIHGFDADYVEAFSLLKSDLYFRHISLAFIQGIREDGLYAHVTENEVIILVRNNKRFELYNQYQVNSEEEYLYFVMLAYNQLQLDTLTFTTHLSGDQHSILNLSKELSIYLSNVMTIDGGFDNMDKATDLYDLYLASICE